MYSDDSDDSDRPLNLHKHLVYNLLCCGVLDLNRLYCYWHCEYE